MTRWLYIFKHLLPTGKAWRLTADKLLRHFFNGLTGIGENAKNYIDKVWLDIFPSTTRAIPDWENHFGIPTSGLSDAARRGRLAGAWKALGGQSPKYIQDVLQAYGFNVYVHEWWVPGTEPATGVAGCATPRSPLAYLRREYTGVYIGVECGEELAACGESFAEAGSGLVPQGYPLINQVLKTVPAIIPLCGEELAACGEELAACGNYVAFSDEVQDYIVPNDPTKWPYFLYIGGESFGDLAVVSRSQKEIFEALCLKICPAHQWLGILVTYS